MTNTILSHFVLLNDYWTPDRDVSLHPAGSYGDVAKIYFYISR